MRRENPYPKARPRARAAPWLAPIARRYYWLRAVLFHPPRSKKTIHERVRDFDLVIHPGVFNPVAFLASPHLLPAIDAVGVVPGARWLDLGTGCGLAALHAARRGAHVTATDINPAAVACARENAARNALQDRVTVLEGDLFAPVAGQRFDRIMFHAPYFPGAQSPGLGQAWHFGDLPQRFANELAAHLNPGGCALLLLSSNGDCAAYLTALEESGFGIEIVLEKELIVELVVAYRIKGHK